jgi:2-phospho-L-lactate/phosphoenolpyruvate guanylyltransferase
VSAPVAVLIPVKAFRDAKLRLATALSAEDRSALARSMADRVAAAAGSLPVAIVCDDAEVVAWAASRQLIVITEPGKGLNRAVAAGVHHLAESGVAQVIVAHADLPMATDLAWVAHFPGVTLVPDRREDGSNVLCVPATAGFQFSYGQGSFRRHQNEARRCGLGLRIVRRPDLAWDVDQPDDLVLPAPA